MSPVGDAFRSRCRMFPSLVNCCTIDWFVQVSALESLSLISPNLNAVPLSSCLTSSSSSLCSAVAPGGAALRLQGLLPEHRVWQRGAEGELLRHLRGDPRQRHRHGRALLLRTAAPLLHHAHLLPGADQPLPVHAGGQAAAASGRKCSRESNTWSYCCQLGN